MCAPFWWSVADAPGETARILHNGSICFVDTGAMQLGITANHVYKQYLRDVEAYGRHAVECQFGSSTIYPENHVIDCSPRWDLATFRVPAVFTGASARTPRAHHHPVQWPPTRAQRSEVVLYGGFPGVLREEKGHIAELPFQWVAGRVSEVTDQNIVLEPEFATMLWQGTETNSNPGGWSGGPVFRSVELPIVRLELVGFIYEFSLERAVLARHTDVVMGDGRLI